ncbi:MAG: cardiolipin synthase, partial [Bacteroidetes bacterium]|nr:cardiolipin synthase [Bacteroidota bacterium]
SRSPILHAKYLTVDGGFSVVGSYNVDRYGSKHNLEIGVLIESPTTAHELERTFAFHLDRSDVVTLAAWQDRPRWQRLYEWLLFLGASV